MLHSPCIYPKDEEYIIQSTNVFHLVMERRKIISRERLIRTKYGDALGPLDHAEGSN